MRNLGLSLSPLFLRLMLAVIFLQAGLGKILATHEVSPADAAILEKMGVTVAAQAAAPATPTDPAAAPATEQPAATPTEAGAPVKVRRVYALALGIHHAAYPEPLEGGAKVRALWPADLAAAGWPRRLAWAVTLTEVVGGACLLLGVLTRVWALALAGVMVGAMWLTQIGPAIQKGETVLGVLPAYDVWGADWQFLWIQFALLMSSLALLFLGAGRLSIDALLFGGGRGDGED